MRSLKRFFIVFLVVYIVIGGGINAYYGPPGFSDEFLEVYKDESDAYLEITKSPEFKLWEERPSANPPDESLTAQITFVEQFRANPDYRAELRRRAMYDGISDWFNFIMLTVLIVAVARRPVRALLERMVTEERERIEAVESRRAAAARRKAKAEQKLEQIPLERDKANVQVAARIAQETQSVQASTVDSLAMVRQELEDRKRQADLEARRRMKLIMANEAVRLLEERYRASGSTAEDDALIDRFLGELGARR